MIVIINNNLLKYWRPGQPPCYSRKTFFIFTFETYYFGIYSRGSKICMGVTISVYKFRGVKLFWYPRGPQNILGGYPKGQWNWLGYPRGFGFQKRTSSTWGVRTISEKAHSAVTVIIYIINSVYLRPTLLFCQFWICF